MSDDGQRSTEAALFDLDGTLCRTDMHHVIFWFVCSLDSFYSRVLRVSLFILLLPVVAVVSIWNEGKAATLLVWIAFRGLDESEVQRAVSKGVTPRLHSEMFEEMKVEIKRHQTDGRKVVVVSGNAHPLIKDFVQDIGSDGLICSVPQLCDKSKRYTGKLSGLPCVSEEKVLRLSSESTIPPLHQCYGYGNSSNDIPFLSRVREPYAVSPSPNLHKYAAKAGWNLDFVDIAKQGQRRDKARRPRKAE